MANTSYHSYDYKFASVNSDGTVSPSINVCAGPYQSLDAATSDAKYVFETISNIPDGLKTLIWVDEKLVDYTWYNLTWNKTITEGSTTSSDVDFEKLNIKFIYYTTDGTTSPTINKNYATIPTNWLEKLTTTASGYVWMSCQKLYNDVPVKWSDGYYWKEPTFLGKAGINASESGSSNLEDIKYIYRQTTENVAPDLDTSKYATLPSGWKTSIDAASTGYTWMSYARLDESGNIYAWGDGKYWKTPVCIGYTSIVGTNETGSSNFEDIKFVYKITADGSTPILDTTKQVSVPTGWTTNLSTTQSGNVWMSCARLDSTGNIYAWPDGKYWKTPMYIGYSSVNILDELPNITGAYTPIYIFKKTTTKLTLPTLNRIDTNYPPNGWSVSQASFDNADGYIWQSFGRKDSNGDVITWSDGNVWTEPILINTIGDPESTYMPTNLLLFSKLFGLVQASPTGVPNSGLTFDTTVTLTSDGETVNDSFYDITVNGVTITGATSRVVAQTGSKQTSVTCYRTGNTLYFEPTTLWTDTNTTALNIVATSGDVSAKGTFLLAKVNAGESIQGIEGSVIRYRGYLKNLAVNDVLCYKIAEDGSTDGITYIDYVKASPSDFGDGSESTVETYYLFTGEYDENQCMKVSSAKKHIGNFTKAESFLFIATDVLLAENALIHNLLSGTLFFYDDSDSEDTSSITGGITGLPKHLGGNYLIFGGSLDTDGSTWNNPNFRVDENGLLHINYSTVNDGSLNYKAYTWQLNIDSLLSQFEEISEVTDGLVTKYSTFQLDIDSILAKVEKEEKTVEGYAEKYAEWELTVDEYIVKVRNYTEQYGKVIDLYSQFLVTAADITSTVTEKIDDITTLMSTIKLTATSISALITENNNILTALGLSESGILMIGKVLTYQTTSGSTPVLTCNSAGLTIKGNIVATSLTFEDDASTYMTNWLKNNSSAFTDSTEFTSAISSLKSLISTLTSQVSAATTTANSALSKATNVGATETTSDLNTIIKNTSTLTSDAKTILLNLTGMDGTIKTYIDNNFVITENMLANSGTFNTIITSDAFINKLASNSVIAEKLQANSAQVSTIVSEYLSTNLAEISNLVVDKINGKNVSDWLNDGNAGELTDLLINGGTIAGWDIASTMLKKGTIGNSGSVALIPGGTTTTVNGTSVINAVITAGNKFAVNSSGGLYSSYGSIGGWDIDSNTLSNTSSDGSIILSSGSDPSIEVSSLSLALVIDLDGLKTRTQGTGTANYTNALNIDGSGFLSGGTIAWDTNGTGYIGTSTNKIISWTKAGSIKLSTFTVTTDNLYLHTNDGATSFGKVSRHTISDYSPTWGSDIYGLDTFSASSCPFLEIAIGSGLFESLYTASTGNAWDILKIENANICIGNHLLDMVPNGGSYTLKTASYAYNGSVYVPTSHTTLNNGTISINGTTYYIVNGLICRD